MMDEQYTFEYIKQLIINNKLTMKNFIRFHRKLYKTSQKMNIWNDLSEFFTPNRKIITHTKDAILAEARKYNSRYQFQLESKNLYRAAVINNILDEACSHMLPVRFSIPQMICKDIFDHILKLNGINNDRTIIYPQELDIYYPTINLGIEYDGFFHSDKSRPEYESNFIRDNRKTKTCQEKNIHLIRIKQLSDNRRNYKDLEHDTKIQIVDHLMLINTLISHIITEADIINYQVDINKFYNMYNLDTIQEMSKNYHNVNSFRKDNIGLYNMLIKIKRLDILDHLRGKKDHFIWASKTDAEIILYMLDHFASFLEMKKNERCRAIIRRRKLKTKLQDAFLTKNKLMNN